MSFAKMLLVVALLLAGSLICAGCSPNAGSNEAIEIVDAAMKNDAYGSKFIEVTVVFRKRVSGRINVDKGVEIFTHLRRYGKVPDKTKLFYFNSAPDAKVFVDLFDLHGNLIRTVASYYDEYIPSLTNGKVAEILPGERKTFMFGVPDNVESYRAWLVSSTRVGP